MSISLTYAGRRCEVTEDILELAEMAYADHGLLAARKVLRELVPTLTLIEACAAVDEARNRLEARALRFEDLTTLDIELELLASKEDLNHASLRTENRYARDGIQYCDTALFPDGQRLGPIWEYARRRVVERINARRAKRAARRQA